MMFFAIYSEVFSETDPVKHDKNILEVLSRVLVRENMDSDCLGS